MVGKSNGWSFFVLFSLFFVFLVFSPSYVSAVEDASFGDSIYPEYIRCNREPLFDFTVFPGDETGGAFVVTLENEELDVDLSEEFLLNASLLSNTVSMLVTLPEFVEEDEYVLVATLWKEGGVVDKKDHYVEIKDCPLGGAGESVSVGSSGESGGFSVVLVLFALLLGLILIGLLLYYFLFLMK